MRTSSLQWSVLAEAGARLTLCALSALLLLSLAACSAGRPTVNAARTPSSPVPTHGLAPQSCVRPPCSALPTPVPYLHTATASNTQGDTTYLDNPLLNGNSSALVTVTQAVVENDIDAHQPIDSPFPMAQVGVWYNASLQRWGIFREDSLAMPLGAVFHVNPIAGASTVALLQVATSSNSVVNYTEIDSPSTNAQSVELFVTPNYNPGGVGASWDTHPLGVISLQDGHWAIYHKDGNFPMTPGATYNVQIGSGGASGGKVTHVVSCGDGCGEISISNFDQTIVDTSQANWLVFATQAVVFGVGASGIGIPYISEFCSGTCPTPFLGGLWLRNTQGFPTTVFYFVYAYEIVCPC